MSRHIVVKSNSRHRRIVAAEEDERELRDRDRGPSLGRVDDEIVDDVDGFRDDIDDMQDAVDDLQDTVDDFQEDVESIEINNNITDHFIAECSLCHKVFISPIKESDQEIESIEGECPLCKAKSEQYLKWVIKEVE